MHLSCDDLVRGHYFGGSMENKVLALGLGLFCVSFSGCGSGDASTAALVPHMELTPARIKSYQVSDTVTCLSLEKVMAAALAARQSRQVVTDMQLLEDAEPVSEAFGDSVIRNTDLVLKISKPVDKDSNVGWKQNGCEAISYLDKSGKEILRFKLVQATPTKLVTEKYSYGGSDEPGVRHEHTQYTYELISTRKLQTRLLTTYGAVHDPASCGIEREKHDVLISSELEFGERLGIAPYLSARLAEMKRRSADYTRPELADTRKAAEQAYCAKLKNKHSL